MAIRIAPSDERMHEVKIWSTIKRIEIVRVQVSDRSPSRPISWRALGPLAISVMALLGLSAGPALAAGSGSSTATINVATPAVLSLTVSPVTVTYASCAAGSSTASTLGFPNGLCYVGGNPTTAAGSSGGVTITNAGAPSQIDVNGANAIPSDAGTPWSLCGGAGGLACSGASDSPGPNQLIEEGDGYAASRAGDTAGTVYSNTAQCDVAFDFAVQDQAEPAARRCPVERQLANSSYSLVPSPPRIPPASLRQPSPGPQCPHPDPSKPHLACIDLVGSETSFITCRTATAVIVGRGVATLLTGGLVLVIPWGNAALAAGSGSHSLPGSSRATIHVAPHPSPTVSSVRPNAGEASGGQFITVSGTGFVRGSRVEIGQGKGAGLTAIVATKVAVVSESEITATTGGPARAGTWNLFVISSGRTSHTSLGDRYRYEVGAVSCAPRSSPRSGCDSARDAPIH
jgi:hypothetical protein